VLWVGDGVDGEAVGLLGAGEAVTVIVVSAAVALSAIALAFTVTDRVLVDAGGVMVMGTVTPEAPMSPSWHRPGVVKVQTGLMTVLAGAADRVSTALRACTPVAAIQTWAWTGWPEDALLSVEM
jgi:hypothetical protein